MAARQRLDEMVDPALTALRQLVDTADSDSVRLSAIKDILDRAGYKPTERVDLTVSTDADLDAAITQRLEDMVARSQGAPALALASPAESTHTDG